MHTIKKQLHEVIAGDKLRRVDGSFVKVEKITLAPKNRPEWLRPIAFIVSDETGRYPQSFNAVLKYAEVTVIPALPNVLDEPHGELARGVRKHTS